jgi:hypothetical protein
MYTFLLRINFEIIKIIIEPQFHRQQSCGGSHQCILLQDGNSLILP